MTFHQAKACPKGPGLAPEIAGSRAPLQSQVTGTHKFLGLANLVALELRSRPVLLGKIPGQITQLNHSIRCRVLNPAANDKTQVPMDLTHLSKPASGRTPTLRICPRAAAATTLLVLARIWSVAPLSLKPRSPSTANRKGPAATSNRTLRRHGNP